MPRTNMEFRKAFHAKRLKLLLIIIGWNQRPVRGKSQLKPTCPQLNFWIGMSVLASSGRVTDGSRSHSHGSGKFQPFIILSGYLPWNWKSLALALYFASRGQGQVRSSVGSSPESYYSQAKVVLSGLGSDELIGGYGRHRTVYGTGGWKAVIDEVKYLLNFSAFLSTFLNRSCSCNRKSIAFLPEIWDEMTE